MHGQRIHAQCGKLIEKHHQTAKVRVVLGRVCPQNNKNRTLCMDIAIMRNVENLFTKHHRTAKVGVLLGGICPHKTSKIAFCVWTLQLCTMWETYSKNIIGPQRWGCRWAGFAHKTKKSHFVYGHNN